LTVAVFSCCRRISDTPNGQSFARQQVQHDDVRDAEDYACGEQQEFDGHARQYTFSRMYVCCGSKAEVVWPE
jgi:hypothetical protein